MNAEASSETVREPSSEIHEIIVSEHEDNSNNSPKQPQELNEHVQALIKELEQYSDAEAKLQRIISFMETALGQNGTPFFKSFWESRGLCLPLFKEHIPPASRVELWDKYSALSKEARRLKELLNEQSAFAEEQIDIAIKALEADIAKLESSESVQVSPLPITCNAIRQHDVYSSMQHELNLLNASASRINALRKELIKTDMRVRKKNKFFQSLSAAGDRVFPRRKELINEISQKFIGDVDTFIKAHFSNQSNESPYVLREEIKSLQAIAKILTLNAHAFNETRGMLSDCWNKLKDIDKERKQQRSEKKVLFQQNLSEVQVKIAELRTEIESGALAAEASQQKISDITAFMRKVELGRDELQILRDEINILRKPILEQLDKEAHLRQEHEQERIRHKQQKIIDLRNEVETLLRTADACEVEKLIENRDALLTKISTSALLKTERDDLERKLKSLRDVIADKKEQNLMSLSVDDRQALEQLYDLLKQRKARRKESKEQIETLRKAAGSSGLDFQKAMDYQAQLDVEKERLEKMNQGIAEIEEKISSIET